MRRLLAKFFCIFTLSLAFAGSVFAKDYPAQSKDFYVNDLANVISEENEKYIIDTNVELRAKTGGQIVVMTVKNLDGKSIETFATGTFRQYGIGDKEKNNGTLILLSVEDRKIRIETGSGAEGFINDGKAGRILDEHVIPWFKTDNWNNGLRDGFDAVLGCYLQEYNIEIDGNTAKYLSDEDGEEISDFQAYMMVGAFFSTFITTPIISALCSNNKHKTRRWIIRGIIAALAAAIYISTFDSVVKGTILMMLLFNFLATFGIQMSGGYSSGGGYSRSSGSSGGHSGGGGSSRGGGASRSF